MPGSSDLGATKTERAVWLSGNTLAGCATVGGSNLDQCSKICKVSKPGSQHWNTVYLPLLGYHVKPLVPCIGRVTPKHIKDPGTFIEKSRVQFPDDAGQIPYKNGLDTKWQCLRASLGELSHWQPHPSPPST